MTDITARDLNPVTSATRRPHSLHIRLPKLSVGSTIAAMAASIGQAFGMAYAAPYQPSRRQATASPETEQGRDPSW
jgi:L-cystine uptake protein TcyP (sodium:dicarboxylate symporter family)